MIPISKKSKFSKRLFSILFSLVFVLALSVPAFAKTSGQYLDTTAAYSEMNQFRTSNQAWYYNPDGSVNNQVGKLQPIKRDARLEQTAQIRAKEIAQSFSHTRPNGQSCFTAYPSDLTAKGENIAAGQTSAQEVINDWKETNNPYNGQGHRRNMLSSKFNAVGIACYVQNGTYYWVQSFGRV